MGSYIQIDCATIPGCSILLFFVECRINTNTRTYSHPGGRPRGEGLAPPLRPTRPNPASGNVGLTRTRVPTATPEDDRGEKAEPRRYALLTLIRHFSFAFESSSEAFTSAHLGIEVRL